MIRDQILLELFKANATKPAKVVDIVRTQKGLSEVLGKFQAQISKAIKLLTSGGLIRCDVAYFNTERKAVKSYTLTSKGLIVARDFSRGITKPKYTEYICDQDRCSVGEPCVVKIEDNHKLPKPKCILKGKNTLVNWQKVST